MTSNLEEYFPNPQKFIPERWIKGDSMESHHNPYAALPFGFGLRMCIGRRLAEMEMWQLTIKVTQLLTSYGMHLFNQFCLDPSKLSDRVSLRGHWLHHSTGQHTRSTTSLQVHRFVKLVSITIELLFQLCTYINKFHDYEINKQSRTLLNEVFFYITTFDFL